jgi:PPOX class probable F420-dependent enzyme
MRSETYRADWRRQMAELTRKQTEFLENPFLAVVTTLRPDGSPHSTVVWQEPLDGGVSFNTETGRVKPANLERDPRASLLIVDPGDPYRWLSVSGRAELTYDGAPEQIDRLSEKYTGKTPFANHPKTERRVSVLVRPEKVTAYNLD